ncbi:methylated-DNA-[protein]-cysteine S-methyltransferase [Bradyrhizobium sp. LM6.10]
MVGRGYAIFDTTIGRCAIIWSSTGVVAVQLPEAREIDTRRRIFQVHPEAREQRPSANAELAIEGIVGLLQGNDPDFSEVSLDAGGVPDFNRRVYEFACTIPRGETRTYHEIAKALGVSGAAHSVAQAIAKNPYMLIVPCHRVLERRAITPTGSRPMAG